MDAIAQGTYQGIKPVSLSKKMDSRPKKWILVQKNGLESIFLDEFFVLPSPRTCCVFLGLFLLAQAAAARKNRVRYPPSPKLRGRTVRSTRMRAPVRSEVGFKLGHITSRDPLLQINVLSAKKMDLPIRSASIFYPSPRLDAPH